MSETFLNCDWGTTRFRLRLVKRATAEIVAEVSSQQGVASLSAVPQPQRAMEFHDVLAEHFQQVSATASQSAEPLPVLISGMASSSIGWQELPYSHTPFPLTGESLQVAQLQGQGALTGTPIYLFSGVRSECDVMRGEEAELIGVDALLNQAGELPQDYQVILPGTHSKHARVEQGVLTSFRTCLTGELFQVLSEKTSLRHARGAMAGRPTQAADEAGWDDAFYEGVELSSKEGLIRSVFQVRTRQLLKSDSPVQSGGFLSGLLVGNELQTLSLDSSGPVILAAAPDLARPYLLASTQLGLKQRVQTIAPSDVTRLSALGQARILQRLLP